MSKDGLLQSTVLPPPSVNIGQKLCSAHAYCPMYGLMYVLVNQEEIWVYYTKYGEQKSLLIDSLSAVVNKELWIRDSYAGI